eukprot:sb/3464843/
MLIFGLVACSTLVATYTIHILALYLTDPVNLNTLHQPEQETPEPDFGDINPVDQEGDGDDAFDMEQMELEMEAWRKSFEEENKEERAARERAARERQRQEDMKARGADDVDCSVNNMGNTSDNSQWRATCRNTKTNRHDSYVCQSYKDSKRASLCPPQLVRKPKNYNCTDVAEWMVLMGKRKKHLQEACQDRDLHPRTAAPKELFHYDKVGFHGLTWCPIYKAGSSNTNAYFCQLYYREEICLDKRRNGANLWRHSRFWAPDAPKLVPRFLITRHPFERLLSGYRDKIETPSQPMIENIFDKMVGKYRHIPRHLMVKKEELLTQAREEVGKFLETNPTKGRLYYSPKNTDNPYTQPLSATFEEFVTSVVMGNNNEHWASVDEFCSPCSQVAHYNYILKVGGSTLHCNFIFKVGMVAGGLIQVVILKSSRGHYSR